ncbi:hypothetical protein B0H17DRAFT_1126346 [Mycena rosella]|uniref:Uncharacterized protein n=1 Tax=Mycena rosella TaxID=1033263 RepID=A0AAD7GUL6_MYCRO|nr:hypothetical protein B0H17DRAFT_1126346 [Mycena rosella]
MLPSFGCIHHLATSDISPLSIAYDDESSGTFDDPLNERHLRRYLQIVHSLGRVCKLWNELTHGLLYENAEVNTGFASLSAAMARLDTARAVRSMRLSMTRFDHNITILGQSALRTRTPPNEPEQPDAPRHHPRAPRIARLPRAEGREGGGTDRHARKTMEHCPVVSHTGSTPTRRMERPHRDAKEHRSHEICPACPSARAMNAVQAQSPDSIASAAHEKDAEAPSSPPAAGMEI